MVRNLVGSLGKDCKEHIGEDLHRSHCPKLSRFSDCHDT